MNDKLYITSDQHVGTNPCQLSCNHKCQPFRVLDKSAANTHVSLFVVIKYIMCSLLQYGREELEL